MKEPIQMRLGCERRIGEMNCLIGAFVSITARSSVSALTDGCS